MAKQLVSKASNIADSTIQKHIRAITGLRENLDAANGEYRAAIKAAKSDGINTKELLGAMAARKREAEDVHGDLRSYVRYLALLHMPVTQLELFGTGGKEAAADEQDDQEDDSEESRWEAEQMGRLSGAAGGLTTDNPHFPDSVLGKAWLHGWGRAQEALAGGRTPEKPAAKGNGVKKASTRRSRSSGSALN